MVTVKLGAGQGIERVDPRIPDAIKINMIEYRQRWIQAIVSGLLIAGFVGQTPVKAQQLYPVDEASQDASFLAFREQLLAAARRRDRQFILNSLAPDIEVSYGRCGSGINCFRQLWGLNRPNNTQFWNIFIDTLSLGGSFQSSGGQRYFCAPYVFTEFPASVNGEELSGVHPYAAIVAENVNVREFPSGDAPVIARFSYEIVKLDQSINNGNSSDRDWVNVVLPNGRQGYVSRQYVRGPYDFRACFKRVNGRWQMTAFIAGD
jgi:hypothetical protein